VKLREKDPEIIYRFLREELGIGEYVEPLHKAQTEAHQVINLATKLVFDEL